MQVCVSLLDRNHLLAAVASISEISINFQFYLLWTDLFS